MPDWMIWLLLAVTAWAMTALLLGLFLGALIRFGAGAEVTDGAPALPTARPRPVLPERRVPVSALEAERRRVLLVDDDAGLRLLLRTTLPPDEFEVEEAESAELAADIARFWRPEVVVLDVGLPGKDGLTFCGELKRSSNPPHVVLLTGEDLDAETVRRAGADASLRKPFSPVELVASLDEVETPVAVSAPAAAAPEREQLLLYARDLGAVVQEERRQRRLLQHGYRQTIAALAGALEAKDAPTGLHGRRVQRFGLDLAAAVDRTLLGEQSLEYGFLLHDIGKIGIPERILQKEGPLDQNERRVMQQHPQIGLQILAGIPLLEGAGLDVVRSHHERWDGRGYPAGLKGSEIPLAARVFAVADALDAITTDRPYRKALPWDAAVDEILRSSGTQLDPGVVAAFACRESQLRAASDQLAKAAA